MLDKESQNQGYLCGRLFAVLDKIQEDANGIHSIRERYMNAASATPSMVFATVLNLSTAKGFPPHLNLQDQGRFFVGYYHQRQDLFMSKENKEME